MGGGGQFDPPGILGLIDYKKAKGTKKCVIKRKLKFGNYKNCLEATELENKVNYLVKNEISVDSLEKDHKDFIKKKNKLKLKTAKI